MITKIIFIERYYNNLEALRDISKDYKMPTSTLSYKAKVVWGLSLRSRSEAAIIAHKKGKKDYSGINNGIFIDDGLNSL